MGLEPWSLWPYRAPVGLVDNKSSSVSEKLVVPWWPLVKAWLMQSFHHESNQSGQVHLGHVERLVGDFCLFEDYTIDEPCQVATSCSDGAKCHVSTGKPGLRMVCGGFVHISGCSC
jgi:hypothetical protein